MVGIICYGHVATAVMIDESVVYTCDDPNDQLDDLLVGPHVLALRDALQRDVRDKRAEEEADQRQVEPEDALAREGCSGDGV